MCEHHIKIIQDTLKLLEEAEKKIAELERGSGVTELFLCEADRLVLRPDRKYIFRKDPNCRSCQEYGRGSGAWVNSLGS